MNFKKLTMLAAFTSLALPAVAQEIPKTRSPQMTESQQPMTTTGAAGTNRPKEEQGRTGTPPDSIQGRAAGAGTGSSSSTSIDPRAADAPRDDVQTEATGQMKDTDGQRSNTAVRPNNPARGTAGTTGSSSEVAPHTNR